MYESPIEIISGELQTAYEDGILKAVRKCDIHCDKEELLKALAYDRDQYRKGYEDAKSRWILCENITEPIDREVLCCDKYGNELSGWLDYNDYEKCWVCESDKCLMYDIIAYTEKPMPYEGGA